VRRLFNVRRRYHERPEHANRIPIELSIEDRAGREESW